VTAERRPLATACSFLARTRAAADRAEQVAHAFGQVHRMRDPSARPVRRGTGLGAARHGHDLPERHRRQPRQNPPPVHLGVGLGVGILPSPPFLGRACLGDRLTAPLSHVLGLVRLHSPALRAPQVPRPLERTSTINTGGELPRRVVCPIRGRASEVARAQGDHRVSLGGTRPLRHVSGREERQRDLRRAVEAHRRIPHR